MTKMYVLQWNAILPNEKSTPIRIIISTGELHNTEQLSAQYFDHECNVHMHNYIHNLLVLLRTDEDNGICKTNNEHQREN